MINVSTHSRAEAAARPNGNYTKPSQRFNTQPRGGGCPKRSVFCCNHNGFNTQPRGGGCFDRVRLYHQIDVSTHSRAEAAANHMHLVQFFFRVSTHSRAEAAASIIIQSSQSSAFQHTAARRRLRLILPCVYTESMFQHTAARRRLLATQNNGYPFNNVSTHSRAEAAASRNRPTNNH